MRNNRLANAHKVIVEEICRRMLFAVMRSAATHPAQSAVEEKSQRKGSKKGQADQKVEQRKTPSKVRKGRGGNRKPNSKRAR